MLLFLIIAILFVFISDWIDDYYNYKKRKKRKYWDEITKDDMDKKNK